ncbi:MAG: hypothetical protein ACYC5V_12535 [Gemmatimonadaceae bacterium]
MIIKRGWTLFAAAVMVGMGSANLTAQVTAQAAAKSKTDAAVKSQAKQAAKVKGKADETKAAVSVTAVFREKDRAVFEDYFATHNMKVKPLPPGMRNRLAKGKPLPPGIAKRVLPPDLLRMAPIVGRDVQYGIVGDAVVATRAGIVIDILSAVLK